MTEPAPQGIIHIVPFGRGAAGIKSQAAPAGAQLAYFGGPVISNIEVIAVFWGPNVNAAVTANGAIDQFYTDITTSRFFDELTEYTTVGVTNSTGTSSNQTIGHGTFAGKFTITPNPTLCPNPTCTLTDAQIQAELTRQINTTHALPAPTSDAHGIVNTFYAIYFPPGVSINDGQGSVSCVSGGFCAYHSNTSSLIPYGVFPDFAPPSGCARGCGAGTLFQNVTSVSSHEMSEAITDAQVGSATVFGPPLAWYDHVPPPGTDPGEIGDICNAQDVSVSAGSTTYVVQKEFSNLQNDCVSAPPVLNLGGPTAPVSSVAFNAPLTLQSSVNSSTLTGYRGTVHFTSSDALAVLPADYTFTAADAGTHTFAMTLKGTGSQTITATDVNSSGFIGSATYSVDAQLIDLQTALPPPGVFSPGQTNANYQVVVSNQGSVSSSGTVTLVNTLGPGLTATAISGTGWNCILATLTCTRSDVIGPGSSYPNVTVALTVAATAPSSTQVSATVSGGGDGSPANNTSTINITVGPTVAITSSSGNVTVSAGQSAVYTFGVSASAAAGTITFSCSGLPTAAACSFNPASLNGTSGNVTMTITTTARSSVFGFRGPGGWNPVMFFGLFFLAALATFSFHFRAPRFKRLAPIAGLMAILIVGIVAGCGGGGSKPPPPPPVVNGTPAGTSAVTFTAISPAGTASKIVNLTVN